MLSYIIQLISFLAAGFALKYLDFCSERKNKCFLPFVLALGLNILCMSFHKDALSWIIGMCFGVFIAKKIDNIYLFAGFIGMIVSALILAQSLGFSLLVFLVFVFFTWLDEMLHENAEKLAKNRYLGLFFKYRFTLRIASLCLVLLSIFNLFYFITFLVWDVGYCGGAIFLSDV